MPKRFPIALFSAMLVTAVLFYIMIGFVRTDVLPPLEQSQAHLVNIEKIDQGKDKKDSQLSKHKKPNKEPTPKLATELVTEIQPDANTIDVKLKLDVSHIPMEIDALPQLQKNWVQPSSLDTQNSSKGLDSELAGEPKSINKVIPVGTRMPNIPKVAWDNKINGWVLLAFTVTGKGQVKDIRILDASPKGVFEEQAVLSVSKWRYRGFIGHDRYVSQKIEFEWKNYPYNWDY